MVRRVATLVAAVALAAVLVPATAGAQETQSPAVDDGTEVPFTTVNVNDPSNPYGELTFETDGGTMPPLLPAILDATATDLAQLELAREEASLAGFGTDEDGDVISAGVPLVGRLAPAVDEGEPLTDTTDPSALPSADTGAPPELDVDRPDERRSFAFTDDSGEPAPPPDDAEEPTEEPSEPSEGIDAEPPPTTTTTAPPATTTTTAPTSSTTASTTTTSTTTPTTTSEPTTTTTTRPTTTTEPTTTTTTRPTTTTTRQTTTTSTSTTTTTTSTTTTTTTTAPTTTTTVAPPTTTTTTPPPGDTFELTQERPSATACVATSASTSTCDAIWAISLGATGQTLSFDVTLRNSGNIDADAVHLWASTSCVTASTGSPAGTGDLCSAIELTIQRYSDAAREIPVECAYGGGTAQVCSLSSLRTLAHFSSTYPSSSEFRQIGAGLPEGASSYLRLTLRLPDVDNRYQRRSATVNLTWRQVQ